ncbi:unnamed protein product [Rhizoctonia solani]|uniref:Uncharacterized protein n=1 Tax=Rhizoctonia solani TaxID=456999 RepID=A0A8H2WJ37_9AGAM|nr:unnamed protein product [Rhizoctonia solani]
MQSNEIQTPSGEPDRNTAAMQSNETPAPSGESDHYTHPRPRPRTHAHSHRRMCSHPHACRRPGSFHLEEHEGQDPCDRHHCLPHPPHFGHWHPGPGNNWPHPSEHPAHFYHHHHPPLFPPPFEVMGMELAGLGLPPFPFELPFSSRGHPRYMRGGALGRGPFGPGDIPHRGPGMYFAHHGRHGEHLGRVRPYGRRGRDGRMDCVDGFNCRHESEEESSGETVTNEQT